MYLQHDPTMKALIVEINRSRLWYHQMVATKRLHIRRSRFKSARMEFLNHISSFLGADHNPIDLICQDNTSGIIQVAHGRKEAYQTSINETKDTTNHFSQWLGGLSTPRLFSTPGNQLKVVRYVSSLKYFDDWRNMTLERPRFISQSIPLVASKFPELGFSSTAMTSSTQQQLSVLLSQLFNASNKGVRAVQSIDGENLITSPSTTETPTTSGNDVHMTDSATSASTSTPITTNTASTTNKSTTNAANIDISWSYIHELLKDTVDIFALTEYMFSLITLDPKTGLRVKLDEWVVKDSIQEKYRSFKFNKAASDRLKDILRFLNNNETQPRKITDIQNRLSKARKRTSWSAETCHPPENQLTMFWLDNVHRLNKGEVLKVRNNNRSGALKPAAASILRDIQIDCGVSETKMPLMVVLAHILFFREVPDEFPARRTLAPHLMRLHKVDASRFVKHFKDVYAIRTKYGCVKSAYVTMDDSKHGIKKAKRKALVIATTDDSGKYIMHCASFAETQGGDSEQNAIHNLNVILAAIGEDPRLPIDEHLVTPITVVQNGSVAAPTLAVTPPRELSEPLKVFCTSFTGCATDNATDALKEGRETVQLFQQLLPPNQRGRYNEKGLGVTVLMGVSCGDGLHQANLCVQHSSVVGFNDVIKGEHRQKHYRQLIQSIWDVLNICSSEFQSIFNSRLQPGVTYKLKAAKERQTRWVANQENARKILKTLRLKDKEHPDTPAIVVAARMLSENLASGTWQKVAKEIAIMANDSRIIVALEFEKKNIQFMKLSMDFHKGTAIGQKTAGFRAFELHHHYKKLVQWWNHAVDQNKSHYSACHAIIETLAFDQQAVYKTRLLSAAMAGKAEVLKMAKNLYSSPLLFIQLHDPIEGPLILRAFLSLAKVYFDTTTDLFSTTKKEALGETGWGDVTVLNEKEKEYKKLLASNQKTTIHHFCQLGLMRVVARKEMKQLSCCKERSFSLDSSFEETYPIIWEHLCATFEGMITSSMICEQLHGLGRGFLNHSQGSDKQDLIHCHKANNLHKSRDIVRIEEKLRKLTKAREKMTKDTNSNNNTTLNGSEGGNTTIDTDNITPYIGQTKLYETKGQIKKHGELALNRAQSYTDKEISEAPNIKTISKSSTNAGAKVTAKLKLENLLLPSKNKDKKRRTNDEWNNEVLELPQDINYRTHQEQIDDALALRCFVGVVWDNIGKDALFKLINTDRVLPYLTVPVTVKNKGPLIKLIKAHLKQIGTIINGKTANTLNDTVFSDSTLMSVKIGTFIKHHTMIHVANVEKMQGKNSQLVRSATRSIFGRMGNGVDVDVLDMVMEEQQEEVGNVIGENNEEEEQVEDMEIVEESGTNEGIVEDVVENVGVVLRRGKRDRQSTGKSTSRQKKGKT